MHTVHGAPANRATKRIRFSETGSVRLLGSVSHHPVAVAVDVLWLLLLGYIELRDYAACAFVLAIRMPEAMTASSATTSKGKTSMRLKTPSQNATSIATMTTRPP